MELSARHPYAACLRENMVRGMKSQTSSEWRRGNHAFRKMKQKKINSEWVRSNAHGEVSFVYKKLINLKSKERKNVNVLGGTNYQSPNYRGKEVMLLIRGLIFQRRSFES